MMKFANGTMVDPLDIAAVFPTRKGSRIVLRHNTIEAHVSETPEEVARLKNFGEVQKRDWTWVEYIDGEPAIVFLSNWKKEDA
jgi:hypothetical protein